MLENIKTKVKSVKFKTILSVVLYCTVLVLAITLYQTYSAFRMSNSGNLFADTSGLICDISLDTNAEYVEDDIAYFFINVQNYRGNLTNDVDIGYKITITNQNGSNGVFKYVDSDGNSNDKYVATLNIPEHTFSTEKETETIKIYVRSSTNTEETVNYNVKLVVYAKLVEGQVLLYDKLLSETYTLDTNVDFGQPASSINGQGLMMKSDTKNANYPVLYYRGDVANNNVIYADFCWLIVRTTETGGVKLIYNGEVNEDGSCNNYSGVSDEEGNENYENALIGPSVFNSSKNSPVYAGYMYNDTNLYFADGVLDVMGYKAHLIDKTIDSATGRHVQNLKDSVIKGLVDDWYEENIKGKSAENLLEDTVWCNDRSVTDFNYSIDNYSTNGYFDFAVSTRLRSYESYITVKTPRLECNRYMDKFTVDLANGNGDLDYPIGLLTADELYLAGTFEYNITYLVFSDARGRYWILSPEDFRNGNVRVLYMSEMMGNQAVDSSDSGVRPSVSLRLGTYIIGGNGSFETPYLVG